MSNHRRVIGFLLHEGNVTVKEIEAEQAEAAKYDDYDCTETVSELEEWLSELNEAITELMRVSDD